MVSQDDDGGLAELFSRKFQASMADAGECVGTLAAQGMGEPSTQMTLNTFHLAGHGGANVTLGIPRLREIVQTASRKISTPSMFIPLPSVDECSKLQSMMTRIALKDIVCGSTVEESVVCTIAGEKKRKYKLKLDLVDLDKLCLAYPQLTRERVESFLQNEFRAKLDKDVRNFLRVSFQMSTTSQRQINDDTGLRVGSRMRVSGDDDGEEPADTPDVSAEKQANVGRRRKTDEENDDDARDEENESDGEGSDAGGQYDDAVEDNTTVAQNGSATSDAEEEDDDDGVLLKRQDSDDMETQPVSKALPVEQAAPVLQRHISSTDQNAVFGNSGALIGNSFEIESRELFLGEKKLSRKILILEVVEELCSSLYIQQTVGITKVHVTNQGSKVGITTEGCNIEFAWGLKDIDHSTIYTNDICQMLDYYGVEACRQSIMKEIQNVFGHYGISVDSRHLSLIADYMTHQGGYRPFNRGGMTHHSSPFLKMSFETSMNFLSSACHDIQMDALKSPAAAIVVGKLVPVGTGVFDLVNDESMNPGGVGTVRYSNQKETSFVQTPHSKKRNSDPTSSASKRTKRFSFD